MLHKMRSSKDVNRKVSPPQPTFMTEDQKSDYLTSLRNHRPARPTGSRPLPTKAATYTAPLSDTSPQLAPYKPPTNTQIDIAHKTSGAPEFRCTQSVVPVSSVTSRTGTGRPLAQEPTSNSYSVRGRKVSPTAVIQPAVQKETSQYRESGSRWLERQEAVALKDALKAMDMQDEEKRIHAAAQDEAAELVWKHRNPEAAESEKGAPYRNPDFPPKNKFKAHLEKGAHARSQSSGYKFTEAGLPKSSSWTSATSGQSKGIDKSSSSTMEQAHERKRDGPNKPPDDAHTSVSSAESARSPLHAALPSQRRQSGGQRNVSDGSSKGVFRNPSDQIYEEPGQVVPARASVPILPENAQGPLRARQRNPLLRGSRPLPDRSLTLPESTKVDRFEIYKNPPSQSRNAAYTTNISAPQAVEIIPETTTPSSTREGIEIRSDDIRAATSMKLKDRSPKLPTPSAVSDRPGRPIVSFDPTWTLKEDSLLARRDISHKAPPLSEAPLPITVSAPAVPTIILPSDPPPPIPIINLPKDDSQPKPIICPQDDECLPKPSVPPRSQTTSSTSKGHDQISARRPLPLPHHSSPPKLPHANTTSRLPWLSPASRAGIPTATCANCSLPISGRIVTASGSSDSTSSPKARFHPECFTCHQCSTPLECVAFYPEPHAKRLERLEAGRTEVNIPDQALEDGNGADLRFYCHLDFHEFFSPRCRSCKTPIEGQAIMAAGHHWHVGHFFCAECGEPFDPNTPFVEKDGYAYCVGCHTRRTSARCKKCRAQILDETTVEALGGKWHEECFCCWECDGRFGEEGRFFVRDVEIEATEKEKRRGLARKMEERAVCERCEGKRLKA